MLCCPFEPLAICRSRSGSILSALPFEFIALGSLSISLSALGSLGISAPDPLSVQGITVPDPLSVPCINDPWGSTALNGSSWNSGWSVCVWDLSSVFRAKTGSSSSTSESLALSPPNSDEADRDALPLLSFREYPSLKSKTPSSCSF